MSFAWNRSEKQIFYSQLVTLVLPVAVQNLMSAVVSASDALMLGMLDQNSLSAISLATQVQFVLNLFFSGLTLGTTILASQYWGKGDREAVEQVLAIATRYSMMISAIFFLFANVCPGMLMNWKANSGSPALVPPSAIACAIAALLSRHSLPPRRMTAFPVLMQSTLASAVTFGRDS